MVIAISGFLSNILVVQTLQKWALTTFMILSARQRHHYFWLSLGCPSFLLVVPVEQTTLISQAAYLYKMLTNQEMLVGYCNPYFPPALDNRTWNYRLCSWSNQQVRLSFDFPSDFITCNSWQVVHKTSTH